MGILKKGLKLGSKGHKTVAKRALKIKKKLPGLRKGANFAAKTSVSARLVKRAFKRK